MNGQRSCSLFCDEGSSFLCEVISILKDVPSHLLKLVLLVFIKTSELEHHFSFLVSLGDQHS
jgi:hypothetical protein